MHYVPFTPSTLQAVSARVPWVGKAGYLSACQGPAALTPKPLPQLPGRKGCDSCIDILMSSQRTCGFSVGLPSTHPPPQVLDRVETLSPEDERGRVAAANAFAYCYLSQDSRVAYLALAVREYNKLFAPGALESALGALSERPSMEEVVGKLGGMT
jgi:hypothetical protein